MEIASLRSPQYRPLIAKVKAAADALVGKRRLLPEDAQRYIWAAENDNSF